MVKKCDKIGGDMRDEKTKAQFIKYLAAHPEQRFWQALRKFFQVDVVAIGTQEESEDGGWSVKEYKDTFFIFFN